MGSEHACAKGTDMIPKRLFSFKELEARCTLEHNDSGVLRIVLVVPISRDDPLRVVWYRVVCVPISENDPLCVIWYKLVCVPISGDNSLCVIWYRLVRVR